MNVMNEDFSSQKALIREYYDALEASGGGKPLERVLADYTSKDWIWRGFHPYGELSGAREVAERFWLPFTRAMSSLTRRQDIFFAGKNEIDGFSSRWVVSQGHLVGLFDKEFLGIPPTGKMAFFRYAEFNKIEDGQITETAFYFDLPHLMIQAGLAPFAHQRGAHLVQPGPATHDGILFDGAPEAEGKATLALINKMIGELGNWDLGLPLEEELRLSWHEDMIWWGPAGIGATYTIPRYAKQHSGPFRAAFADRSKVGHLCRLAEGQYGGFFGWPNFRAKLAQPFLGAKPNGEWAEFRVIDIYRRAGDRLAENWVFIDIPHWLLQHGVDILPRQGLDP